MLHTMHVMPDNDSARLRRMRPGSMVTAVSRYQWSRYPDLPPRAVVHHGVADEPFTFQPRPSEYVCYVGRFIPGKGPRAAVDAARRLAVPIVLAGPPSDHYDRDIAPLVDGTSVRFVGFVSGVERDRLLGGARALLYPVEVPEPFGLVLIEAMMCGTPVAALAAGAVPEIVDEGVTGHVAATPAELPLAVERALRLDRAGVRRRAVQRFSHGRMVDAYEALYEELRARAGEPGPVIGSPTPSGERSSA
jgi:glycosyltransferase involved in cell wall biosynthesis